MFEIDRNLRLPRNIGPDAFGYKARFTIHAWTSGGKTDTKVWMQLNHTLLEPSQREGRYAAEVPRV